VLEPGRRTLDNQKRFWDWHWRYWHENNVLTDWAVGRGDVILALLRSLPLVRPRILDLGCGMGWFTERFAQLGPTTGIDLSTEAVATARARCPHITFIAGNVYDSPLPAAHFDVVVSQEVLARVDDQSRYLERAGRGAAAGRLPRAHLHQPVRAGPPGSAQSASPPPELIERFVNRRELRRLLRPHFDVTSLKTHLPIGDAGILRFVNSYKLNRLLALLIPSRSLERIKEWAGLGYTLVAVARNDNCGVHATPQTAGALGRTFPRTGETRCEQTSSSRDSCAHLLLRPSHASPIDWNRA